MNFATVIAAFTPKVSGFNPITFKSAVFFNEEEFLSEPQPDKERTRYFASNDGNAGQYIDIFAVAGTRDLTLLDGPEADQLIKWAFSNPQPTFDLAFRYQRNDQTAAEVRTQFHANCKIMNHPVRALSNDIAVVRFTFHYGKYSLLGPTGQPV
jgi:hypothetical protein